MRWRQQRRSSNVEDRRGGMKRGAKIGGIGTILLVLLGLFFGQDPVQLLAMLGDQSAPASASSQNNQKDEGSEFVSVILASTEDVWSKQFAARSMTYRLPNLVLFTDSVQSACGMSTAASGPFYCPGDDKVYIDLSFYRELESMGGVGDFARAYVLGHEIGHHVQNQQGISMKVQRARSQLSKIDGNALSVLAELQADCYAGVWAHHAHKQSALLEQGDIEEGLNAAASIGDDQLMKRAGQRVRPDGFTHGSSQQRMHWFMTGLKSGRMEQCNTFAQG